MESKSIHVGPKPRKKRKIDDKKLVEEVANVTEGLEIFIRFKKRRNSQQNEGKPMWLKFAVEKVRLVRKYDKS